MKVSPFYLYRRLILGALLLATITASLFIGLNNSDTDIFTSERLPNVSPGQHSAISTTPRTLLDLKLPRRQQSTSPITDIFSSKSWYIAPVTINNLPPLSSQPQDTPPSIPSAPQLPYTYLGRMWQSDGRWCFFLAKDNEVHLVFAGEILEDLYRVDGVTNGKLDLIYLPLNITQTLNIEDYL